MSYMLLRPHFLALFVRRRLRRCLSLSCAANFSLLGASFAGFMCPSQVVDRGRGAYSVRYTVSSGAPCCFVLWFSLFVRFARVVLFC